MPQLTTTYAASARQRTTWLTLYQEPIIAQDQQLRTGDLAQMYYMGLAGLSAKLYQSSSCPVELVDGRVRIPLDFYVFPSELGLSYQLSNARGRISDGIAEEPLREQDLIFDNTDTIDLGSLATDLQYTWLTEAHDELSRPLPRPDIQYIDGKIKLSTRCFAIIRLRCRALGYRHTLTIELTKYEQEEDDVDEVNWSGYSITNLQAKVLATWMEQGQLQSNEIDLKIPPCVEDLLATCPDGALQGQIGTKGGLHYLLFYSTCTGLRLRVTAIRNGEAS